MNFVRLKDKRTGIEYDWMAVIKSIPELMEIEELFVSRNAWCIVDYLGSKDYAHLVNNTFEGNLIDTDRDHCHPSNLLQPFLAGCVLGFPENKKINPMVYFTEKLSETLSGKIRDVAKCGKIYVNKYGGYFTWHKDLVELETVEGKKFPQINLKDIKVSKWPQGVHWYITVNGSAITIDGIEKWKTEEDAWVAAKNWSTMGKM